MTQMSIDQAISTFRKRAKPLVVTGDKQALRALFAELTAAAAMTGGDEAFERMEQELRTALVTPNRRVRRNLFPGIYETTDKGSES
jgi:hypothetical protein